MTYEENLILAIKGRHKNQPNIVSDIKMNDVEQRLIEINNSLLGNEGGVNTYTTSKQPYPARLMPNEVNGWLRYPGYEMRYKALDKEQNLYATTAQTLRKIPLESALESTTIADWTILWQPNTAETGQINASAILVTLTNRVVACTQFGHVYVSDENQKNFLDTGIRMHGEGGQQSYCHYQFGYGQYENLVWVSSYGNYPSKANQAYLSEDYGATWIRMTDIPYIYADQNVHIHDIQYDPYADRFWVVLGDQDNCNIFYSDNKGVEWKPVFGAFSEDVRNTQLTSIACFPHGVAFGSDHAISTLNDYPNNHMEDCIRYWKRPKGNRQPVVDPATIETIYRPYGNNMFRCFALKVWQGKVGDNIVTLMPWYGAGTDETFLTATVDGINWYEIYRGKNPGSWQIAGVDDKNRIIGFDKNADNQICLMSMPMPDWI